MVHNKYKIVIVMLSLYAVVACKKNISEEQAVLNELKTQSFTYYQNNNVVLNSAGNSPHGQFKLKFNSIAQAALTSSGKLPQGSSFPDGSIIVKEIYDNGTLTLNAIMKKDSKSTYSALGWLWGEYNPDGKASYSITKNGSACISCHKGNVHRDFVNSFDLH